MASTPDAVLDLPLAEIATATEYHLCSAEPADHAGIAAVTLGDATLTAGDGNGDYTIADGDVSGRKVTVGAQTGISITTTGSANFIALSDGTTLKHVADGDGQAVSSGGTADTSAFDIEFEDPA